jgi:hypothetical protein
LHSAPPPRELRVGAEIDLEGAGAQQDGVPGLLVGRRLTVGLGEPANFGLDIVEELVELSDRGGRLPELER